MFKDFAEDTIIEKIIQKNEEFPIESCYEEYTISEKIGILVFLLRCVFDTKEIHDELSKWIEDKSELIRERGIITSQIKDLESQLVDVKNPLDSKKILKVTGKIQKLQVKSQKITQDIEDIHTRTTPLGTDKDYNEFYLFGFDMTKIYVKTLDKLEEDLSEDCENGYWYIYDSLELVDSLIRHLVAKGFKESKIADAIKSNKSKLSFDSSDIITYPKNNSELKDLELSFDNLKERLIGIDSVFSKFLKKGCKQWESDIRIEE